MGDGTHPSPGTLLGLRAVHDLAAKVTWFNENDPHAAQWIRNLNPGATVDERSIKDIRPEDIPEGRAHFFAGIGGWEYALRLAGWSAERDVWTGSCPCQPFSVAGKRQGEADERHLWPDWLELIAARRPATIFGEQVSSDAGRGWLSGVRADLEKLGYEVGAADLCAASVGAPHIRQRLYWVAHAIEWADNRGIPWSDKRAVAPSDGNDYRQSLGLSHAQSNGRRERRAEPDGRGIASDSAHGGLGHTNGDGPPRGSVARQEADALTSGAHSRLGDSVSAGDEDDGRRAVAETPRGSSSEARQQWVWPNPWEPSDLVWAAAGKARRLKRGLEPLVDGLSYRVGSGSTNAGKKRASMLRGYGNAIVPTLAAVFIRAFMDVALCAKNSGAEM